MADVKYAFGAATAITLTLNSLASSATAGRASTAVDNGTNLYLDALVDVRIVFPNSAPGSDSAIYVFAYASLDGTNYPEDITGTDAALTFKTNTPLPLLGVIPAIQNEDAYWGPWSVASCFGGILPPKWGIAIRNFGGQTLTASNNTIQYRGVYRTVT